MNFTYLTSFYFVVTKSSFSKAATFLGYSQGNISQHIRKLEDFYGTPLLFKRKQKVILTEAGKSVFEFSRKMLEQHDELQNKIKQNQQETIAIGTIDSISSSILMGYIRELKREMPAAKVKVIVEDEPALLEQLESGELDVIIIFDELLAPQPHFLHYYAEETFELVKRRSSGKNKNVLEMILTDAKCSYRKALLKQYRVEMNISVVMEVESTDTIKKMIASGTESTFLPKYLLSSWSSEEFERTPLALDQSFYVQCLFAPEKNHLVLAKFTDILLHDSYFQYQS
ncbi:LysR family transcriptional regulator [Listeria booriae]|uniref:LysR family transcriptional regulator n=1 Tax=Listeria booriae TaxID=1552123 RepID=A0A842FBU8_9LIST|nr:LysR family transcriptional regulator [Listeria booriae]MBC2240536.1 LysR family transcriptional regulator [Listeria booriae]